MEQNHPRHSSHAGASDSGDAVMARWLQSAGLQHLAAPLAAAALDHRLLPSLLMQVPALSTMAYLCPFVTCIYFIFASHPPESSLNTLPSTLIPALKLIGLVGKILESRSWKCESRLGQAISV